MSRFVTGLFYSSRHREYLPDLERARARREQTLQTAKQDSMNRLMKDLAVDRADPEFARRDQWEATEDEDDEGDINIIDRCELYSHPPSALVSPHTAPAEESWPGQFARARRQPPENINWPRPS